MMHVRMAMMRRCGLDDPTSLQGRKLLQLARASLRDSFALVGVVERWDESMRLLRKLTGCDEWVSDGIRTHLVKNYVGATHNASMRTRPANQLRAHLNRTCPETVRTALMADTALYDEASAIFAEQLLQATHA